MRRSKDEKSEEEESKKSARKRKEPEEKEPEEEPAGKEPKRERRRRDDKDEGKGNRCPHGHTFGDDWDDKDECGKCKVWDACGDEYENNKDK